MPIAHAEILLRMGSALVLSGAIGFEREARGRAAGLRTHVLVALAAATFAIVSTQFVYFQAYGTAYTLSVDPSRIAAGVVMGVGFLGAGAISRLGVRIAGLTTGASVFLVAAIGAAAGAGMFFVAWTTTAGTLFALAALRTMERKPAQEASRRVTVSLDRADVEPARIFARLREQGAEMTLLSWERDLAQGTAVLAFDLRAPRGQTADHLVSTLEELATARKLRVERLDG